jgi:protein-disulfide isomerase
LQNGVFANNTLKDIQIGNEDAPITIIEYRSLTCSHCAEFSKSTFPELKEKYIDTGKIKFRLRPFALNAIDLNAFRLLHCSSEEDFFNLEKLLFKDQDKWLITSPNDQALQNSTDALGKYGLLFGITKEEYEECLADEEITDFILTMRMEGSQKYNINSTPSFVVNDEVYGGNKTFKEFEIILEKSLN